MARRITILMTFIGYLFASFSFSMDANHIFLNDEHYAVVEIDVEEMKNDMVRRIQIESTITVSVLPEYQEWFEESLGELEDM